ncbi:hypothetical protein CXB49_00165 [Chromobacterium sp. ATCC 53434]|uniref:substrate-binding periplasmic protein n=1 Tax=Chromobacterium TaxID=535 RepID=UPI000C770D09|nr:transporter substrate-binding domain-containing protein [Chromobacterium sp. ATCC 53434]AUH49363.1 hypothetical protein CXB49_00165 [Chromobacterium sp. ATCC 53434]
MDLIKFIVYLFLPTLSYAEEVSIVTGEFPPFSSEAMQSGGVATEIVKAVCDVQNISINIKYLPFPRAELLVQTGKAFAVYPYQKNAERRELFYFSDSIAPWTGRFFYKKSHIKSPPLNYNWESLKPYSMMGTIGYWYVPIFKKKGLNIELGNSDVNAFRMLSVDRADLVPASTERGWWIIKHEFPKIMQDDFATLEKPLINGEMFLMVSKQYPNSKELLDKFNSGLGEIIKNGTYNQIVTKYKKIYHIQEGSANTPLVEQ